jgi:L-ascorbate metabolism protein UlaG (beta-lactamase superfamily)
MSRTLATLLIATASTAVIACEKTDRSTPVPTPSAASPAHVDVPPASSAAAPAKTSPDKLPTSGGELTITPVQHGTVFFEWQGKAVYLDPAPGAKYESLPKADVILITDIHADHMSPPTVAALRKDDTPIVVPPAVAPNFPPQDLVVMKNGDKKQIAGLGVEAIPMYNLKRGPSADKLYHDKGRGNGYVLTFADKRVYVSGDTECIPEMKALENIDVAFVCMNLPYTMPPAEAAECIRAFKPKVVYPYHYRGSNLGELEAALADQDNVEIRIRNWYP